jgi:glycosyltransferase involved in cell wall biosynthesis
MNAKKPTISGFFPFLNDWGTIGSLVAALDNILKAETSNYEIIVVDDGSDESSKDILRTLKKKFSKLRIITHTKNQGYGGALKSGIYNSRMEWIFYTDGDAQYDPRDLHFLLTKIKKC